MLSHPSLRVWCALVLVTPACVSLEDIPRAQDGGQEESEVNGEDAGLGEPTPPDLEIEPYDAGLGEPVGPDAEIEPYADAGTGEPVGPDAQINRSGGDVDTGVPIEPQTVPCAKDADCSSEEICLSQLCTSRCVSDGPCIALNEPRGIPQLLADEQALYWSLESTRDSFGNSRSDGEIWRRVPGQQAIRLTDKLSTEYGVYPSFRVKDGYVYFNRGNKLYRTSVQASGPEELLYTVPGTRRCVTWNVGAELIAFGSNQGLAYGSRNGGSELIQVRSESLYQEGSCGGSTLIVSGTRIYFTQDQDGYTSNVMWLEVHAPTPVMSTEIRFSGQSWNAVREPYVYAGLGYTGGVFRFDLGGGPTLRVGGMGSDPWLVAALSEKWVFWIQPGEQGPVYGRASLLDIGLTQKFLPDGTLSSPKLQGLEQVAVVGNTLYFTRLSPPGLTPSPNLLFELSLPAPPCSALHPCEGGLSCGADNLCH